MFTDFMKVALAGNIGYGAEYKGVRYVASHAARRRVNETRDPLAQLGSDPIWK
jgi:hypothetical protein